MSTNQKIESTETAVVPAASYTATAQERIEELRRWRDQIPRFAVPATADATRRLISVASVPPEFLELTSIATANHKPLVRGEGLTPEQSRDLVSYADAIGPLADELEALAKFVRYSAAAARSTAGHEALTTYALAVRLSKRPETAYLAPHVAYLAPHVADMRRALGRGRKSSPEVQARKAAARAAKAAAKGGTTPQPELKPQQ